MRHDRPVAAAVRRPEVASAARIVVVVVEIPLLAGEDRLMAASALTFPARTFGAQRFRTFLCASP
jgi:hypothetical protein